MLKARLTRWALFEHLMDRLLGGHDWMIWMERVTSHEDLTGCSWKLLAIFRYFLCNLLLCFFFTNSIWTLSAWFSMRIQLNLLTSSQLFVSTPPGSTKSRKISVKIVKTLNISNSADIYTMKINPNWTCTVARASTSAVDCVPQLLSLVSSQGYAVINLMKKK